MEYHIVAIERQGMKPLFAVTMDGAVKVFDSVPRCLMVPNAWYRAPDGTLRTRYPYRIEYKGRVITRAL